jgi:sarcosine oxidase subunit delta
VRSVYEFRWGGEVKTRPGADAEESDWTKVCYAKTNTPGQQTEWWYHRLGCRQWFQAVRNTTTNAVIESFLPEERGVRD